MVYVCVCGATGLIHMLLSLLGADGREENLDKMRLAVHLELL